ncbi:MAG: CocE/NonD family hydrolase [Tannerellaceae bacterium]|jgi:putative CocE/NonD family hydrolase|nr:CocE/NonD family hydrolase [Tannerellaceae bacterium]
MRILGLTLLFLLLVFPGTGKGFSSHSFTEEEDSVYIREHFIKMERRIPMRDGKKLFTSIYIPKDQSRKYPVLLNRTPYSVKPYGEEEYKTSIGPNRHFIREGYIFVYQDVRGRWMSEGEYVNVRPHIPQKKDREIDESSDTYDTIEWLIKNIACHNGRVGIYGISYPGFYSTAGIPDSHPALKAVSPQAPVTDWFIGDDIFHNGAFFLSMFTFFSHFGVARPEPTTHVPTQRIEVGSQDGYTFFLEAGTFDELNEKYFHNNIAIWNEFAEHGVYDDYWQKRTLLPYLTNVKPAVMTVGGWFDAEDLYGPLKTYAAIRDQNPAADNRLVMGPWPHGEWEKNDGTSFGHVHFGTNTSEYYRKNIELPFFNYYLKNEGELDLAKVTVFETGSNQWKSYDTWPPANATDATLYLESDGKISFTASPTVSTSYDEYISDPQKPVPYTSTVNYGTIREYMIEDQRFAASRPDVLVYKTPVLDEAITLTGPLYPKLYITTTGTDADFVVKLIDVYPDTLQNRPDTPSHIRLGGYQQLVRADVIRAKFRNDFTHPSPIIPGQVTEVKFELQDVAHTFKKGHRLMIQVQSSWFPLVDRNPNCFLDIFHAKASDYQKATIRVYTGGRQQSQIAVKVLPK